MPSINLDVNNHTEQNKEENDNPEQKPPTLTDHLNKKLLNSFLTRINSGDSSFNQMFNNNTNVDSTSNKDDFA